MRVMLTRLSKLDFNETACLHDSPEDCPMYLLASCPARSRANAVLAVLPVHAQPVQGVRAQQAQRMHHRNAYIYMALVPSGVRRISSRSGWQLQGREILVAPMQVCCQLTMP